MLALLSQSSKVADMVLDIMLHFMADGFPVQYNCIVRT